LAVRYVTDSETRSIIDLDECNEIIEGLFRDEHNGLVENKPTVELAIPKGGVFRIKAGGTYGYNTFGFKAYPFGGRYLITIYDLDTGLDGMVEARGLTEARTGAVSAIGTKYMAREDATTMGIIGTGREARAQLASICKVRPFKLIKAYSRSDENRRTFATEMSEKLGIEVVPVATSREAVHDVDVLTVITSASQPVFDGHDLSEGTHINGVGATTMNKRELDEVAVSRCSIVAVEHFPQAHAELGELHYAADRGLFDWGKVVEMKDIVAGETPGRNSPSDITLFDTIGVGAEDVALATYVLKRARAHNVGVDLPIEPPYVNRSAGGGAMGGRRSD
jgi:ornithine cyclodeaminase/alanine dehydrogenase-like protein (mu-crystallin family)